MAKSRRKPVKQSAVQRTRTALATYLGRQSDDVWGLLLILLGLLAGLGIYADLTGPLGRLLRDGSGAVFGWSRLLLPLVLCGVGAVLVRGRMHSEPGRIAIGAGFLVVAVCGLLHLALGAPPWGADLDLVRSAGGLLGLVVAEPMRQVVAVWGAALVLATLLVLSVLILTHTSVRAAIDLVVAAMHAVGRGARVVHRWVTSPSRSSEKADTASRHPSAAEAPKKKPRRQPGADPTGATDADVSDRPDDQGKAVGARAAADTAARAPVEIHLPTGPVPSGEQLSMDLGPAAAPGTWRLPPLALLKRGTNVEVDRRQIEQASRALEQALAAHHVETRVIGATCGPTVTRYELELGPGVKVARVTSLHKDIAYAMAAADVRILAPIPGRSAIGVEVPNAMRQLVALGDILTSEEAHRAVHPLEVGVGRDIAGRPVMESLAAMPHILIAGATGAGKSSCINSIITSVLLRATPDQVRMILIDPKRVELGQYNGLPHLLTQVVVNPKKAANALQWVVHEMERRADLLAEVGVRDITGYNSAYDRGELGADEPRSALAEPSAEVTTYERLPFILVVVDELNDLMMVAARDVEESICRIAQMGRAFGIHLVIATQRPSVDVITGVIKANVPSRLAFAVSSLADSRVILDQPGAERLVGKGDMLLLTASSSVARRIQGPWVSEEEVRKVVAHWRRQGQTQYVEGVEGEAVSGGPAGIGGSAGGEDDDDKLLQAMELVVRSQLGSTSMLQRKLQVGFARAGRLMDLLEQRGIVGPSTGSKAREVLMSVEELEGLLGNP